MTIQVYQDFYPYVLKILEDKKTYKLKDLRDRLAVEMNISEEDRKKLLPSKTQSIFDNRANWACYYLKRAGILDSPGRGKYLLAIRGEKFIKNKGYHITGDDLMEYKSFREFVKPNNKRLDNNDNRTKMIDSSTPEDQLNEAFKKIHSQLSDDLLNEIMSMSPLFFERLVLDLLYSMGYGGKNENRIIHTNYSQDDGIDGLIKEDELGLDYIYVQAKRWSSTIGQPEIQKFSGALSGKGAKKGIFITTSSFSKKAIEYADNHQVSRIILIDRKKLTNLMITYGVGLSTEYTYKIQKIDRDYFDEERY